MLNIQLKLRSGVTLERVVEEHKLKIAEHPIDPLVILNYDVESRKDDIIARECRGLTLEKGTWNIVAKPFSRFFNYGEMVEEQKNFDWNNFVAQEKVDGSIIIVYLYNNEVRVNTRGSFSNQKIDELTNLSWEELFWKTQDKEKFKQYLLEGETWCFELCSLYNKVVKEHKTTHSVLLSAFEHYDDQLVIQEKSKKWCDELAESMGLLRPKIYDIKRYEDIAELFSQESDPTFEGFVLRDMNDNRIKVKSPSYVALHALKGNNNEFALKNLIPFIFSRPDDVDEFIQFFPEVKDKVLKIKEDSEALFSELMELWNLHKDKDCQKEFALSVNHSKIRGFLFNARKRNVCPSLLWKEQGADFMVNLTKRG